MRRHPVVSVASLTSSVGCANHCWRGSHPLCWPSERKFFGSSASLLGEYDEPSALTSSLEVGPVESSSLDVLERCNQRYRLFQPGDTVVEVGCLPGVWGNFIMNRISPKKVSDTKKRISAKELSSPGENLNPNGWKPNLSGMLRSARAKSKKQGLKTRRQQRVNSLQGRKSHLLLGGACTDTNTNVEEEELLGGTTVSDNRRQGILIGIDRIDVRTAPVNNRKTTEEKSLYPGELIQQDIRDLIRDTSALSRALLGDPHLAPKPVIDVLTLDANNLADVVSALPQLSSSIAQLTGYPRAIGILENTPVLVTGSSALVPHHSQSVGLPNVGDLVPEKRFSAISHPTNEKDISGSHLDCFIATTKTLVALAPYLKVSSRLVIRLEERQSKDHSKHMYQPSSSSTPTGAKKKQREHTVWHDIFEQKLSALVKNLKASYNTVKVAGRSTVRIGVGSEEDPDVEYVHSVFVICVGGKSMLDPDSGFVSHRRMDSPAIVSALSSDVLKKANPRFVRPFSFPVHTDAVKNRRKIRQVKRGLNLSTWYAANTATKSGTGDGYRSRYFTAIQPAALSTAKDPRKETFKRHEKINEEDRLEEEEEALFQEKARQVLDIENEFIREN